MYLYLLILLVCSFVGDTVVHVLMKCIWFSRHRVNNYSCYRIETAHEGFRNCC